MSLRRLRLAGRRAAHEPLDARHLLQSELRSRFACTLLAASPTCIRRGGARAEPIAVAAAPHALVLHSPARPSGVVLFRGRQLKTGTAFSMKDDSQLGPGGKLPDLTRELQPPGAL